MSNSGSNSAAPPPASYPLRGQFIGAARIQCSCGRVSKVTALQPGRWLYTCGFCNRTRAIGLAAYDLPSGPRLRVPADLAIPTQEDEAEVEAEPGQLAAWGDDAMPIIEHDLEMWYPARPVTQHILEDGRRSNVGITPRRR